MTSRWTLLPAGLVASALMVPMSGAAAAAPTCATGWSDAGNSVCEQTLTYNGSGPDVTPPSIGSTQLVRVPPGVSSMQMVVDGAEGASSAVPAEGNGVSAGGVGGQVAATVPVTPGDVLTVIVGESGSTVPPGGWVLCGTCTASGAFGAGGLASSNFGGDGGGGSFVFDGLVNPDGSVGNPLVVAGGGGGGGYDYNTTASHGAYGPQQAPGGAGSGVTSAGDGLSVAFQYDPTYNAPTHYPPGGGVGATPSSPGAGGHSLIPPSDVFGQVDGLPGGGPASRPDPSQPQSTWLALGWGGNSQKGTCCYYYGEGGGGGGGYYGGGAGGSIEADLEGGGGGGGVGFVAPGATNVTSASGVQHGDGQVTLRYLLPSVSPGITSASSTAASVGSSFTFTVTTFGSTVPVIKEKGKLPKGVRFRSNHDGTATLSGTPISTKTKSAAGTYPVTLTATFGKGKSKVRVTQTFVLTVT